MQNRISLFHGLLLILLTLAACQNQERAENNTTVNDPPAATESPSAALPEVEATVAPAATESPTVTPSPVPTERPPKVLTVCMSAEPESLYLYGDSSLPATAVRHGIYENLYTTLSYGYQAQGLQKLPRVADGDAVIEPVTVNAGDRVVNAAGDVVTLNEGERVINADGGAAIFDGAAIAMSQMVVDFSFEPLVWSDGTPVTAEDSVYSFGVAADNNTPGSKFRIERTAEYVATGQLSLRWKGLPGYVDSTYFTNVWPPLPRHQLEAYSATELLQAEETNRFPLSNGPFMVAQWTAGEQIELVRNPHYYRAEEDLPRVDRVIFRFAPDAGELLQDEAMAGCDLVTQDVLSFQSIPAITEAEETGALVSHIQPGIVFEHIDFGIDSYANYGDGNSRPDWFEDARVRQAMTLCTDRQRMVDELLYGRSEVMPTYIPGHHPLYPDDVAGWPYDPQRANALLDEVGYVDTDEDGTREDPLTGLPFRVTLGTDGQSEIRRQVAERFRQNMGDCGIEVELAHIPADQWYAEGPDGPLFGRRFDLGAFAWLTDIEPPCNLYLSDNITGPAVDGFGGWGNLNETGWASEAYDAACRAALNAPFGTAAYEENHQEAVRIFSQELPVIPLFLYGHVAVTRPEVMNFELNPTQPSELWNLYALDLPQASP